jgi:hypothetical protein
VQPPRRFHAQPEVEKRDAIVHAASDVASAVASAPEIVLETDIQRH